MLGLMMNDITLHSSLYLDSKLMKKLLVMFLLLGTLLPSAEAGVSPEGRPRTRKPRCKDDGKVVVCTMPRPRKCGSRKRPCIRPGYYHPSPPLYVPHR
jgi:hypothetical protein